MTRKEHLLTIAAEEACELGQRITKALRFSLEEIQPGQELTNAERIMEEYHDLFAMFQMLHREGFIDGTINGDRCMKKISQVEKYLEYSKHLGTLVEDETI
jgi:hypothetical protein